MNLNFAGYTISATFEFFDDWGIPPFHSGQNVTDGNFLVLPHQILTQ